MIIAGIGAVLVGALLLAAVAVGTYPGPVSIALAALGGLCVVLLDLARHRKRGSP